MSSLRDLQHSLAVKMEEVKQRDALIQSLEREIRSRDEQIGQMQAELDKFKQILKPMTQQLAQNLTIQATSVESDEKEIISAGDKGQILGFVELLLSSAY